MHATDDAGKADAQNDTENQFDVGDRLRLVRQSYGLSQRALAVKAGVTHSLVSLIEKNKVSPSVASLKKILEAINYPLTDFFALALPPVDQIFLSRRRTDTLVERPADAASGRRCEIP